VYRYWDAIRFLLSQHAPDSIGARWLQLGDAVGEPTDGLPVARLVGPDQVAALGEGLKAIDPDALARHYDATAFDEAGVYPGTYVEWEEDFDPLGQILEHYSFLQEFTSRTGADRAWMVLKFAEQDPLYRALLAETLAEIAPLVAQATGAMLKQEAFVFISSPGSVTPFHFDPEHNILLQIRGSKTMNVYPAGDEAFADGVAHEAFHAGGHRNLPWREDFSAAGEAFELSPGEAIYVPVKAPHWVQNGPEVSISFSITWRSEWSYREEYARRMNALLRRAGLNPASPRRYPHQNHLKSLGYRLVDKARRTMRPQP
jgi:hypothetical protein